MAVTMKFGNYELFGVNLQLSPNFVIKPELLFYFSFRRPCFKNNRDVPVGKVSRLWNGHVRNRGSIRDSSKRISVSCKPPRLSIRPIQPRG